MAKKVQKKKAPEQKPVERKKAKAQEAEGFGFTRWNYILFGIALGVIALGFIFLGTGDITIAPFLLVGGYVGLVPLAILFRADWPLVQRFFGPKVPASTPPENKEVPTPQSSS
jgi:hypothetical protein